MASIKKLKKIRERRQKRVRGKIFGTQAKPRLSVFRSSKHVYVQAIADDVGMTIAEASTKSVELKDNLSGLNKTDAAAQVGKLLANRLISKNVKNVAFDRGKYLYHGRIKALAEAARKEGLNF